MDPYISVSCWPIYPFMHPEPIDFGQDPLALSPMQTGQKSFDANQAISTILFERSSRRFHDGYPSLRKIRHRRLAFFAYPLSGDFECPALMPRWMTRPLLALERVLGALSRYLAFRILVVLEKGNGNAEVMMEEACALRGLTVSALDARRHRWQRLSRWMRPSL